MFTGIVEELGTVTAIDDLTDAIRLSITAHTVLDGTGLGDSIAVNGCCLTVVSIEGASWTADVMKESLDKTSMDKIHTGDRVNLERAVTAEKRLGGHIVQGHVDGVGHVVRRQPSEHWEVVEISLPPELSKYLVDKGSITVDGVSLTVVEAGPTSFTISLIPETLARTTLDVDLGALPQGVDTVVGEAGLTLSGGQRQRTALARGLYRAGSLLMLDDVLSAVDHHTEQQLIEGIRSQSPRPTTVIAAHRLSAIAHADIIVVLEEGRMIDAGTHAELSQREGPYRETWLRQSEQKEEEA